jgi:uncharacterized membrane protein affecting hemolysin expression
MLKDLRKNEQGLVFVAVLSIIIVVMILTVSILSINVSQVSVSEEEVRRLQAEMLAQGAMTRMFANQMTVSARNILYTQAVGATTYTINATRTNTGGGISNLNVIVTY